MIRAARILALLALALPLANAGQTAPRYRAVPYAQLLGWSGDNHQEALDSFLKSCMDIKAKEWKPLCRMAETRPYAKTFFETFFTPVEVRPGTEALFTGYYEPVLNGSLYKVGPYQYPIYEKPADLTPKDPNLTRAAISAGALRHKGLEIAYVDDPVEAYFLHIQGSGRIRLTNGNVVRVGYAAENGHVYRSAPRELIRMGEVTPDQASIEGIKAWAKANPDKAQAALDFNASYVFFRKVETLTEDSGPYGALERPITPLRSIAVDPRHVQLGAPVWIEKGGRNAMRRLMVAQDVGSAIKGPQRADIFFGTGAHAGKLAGETRNGGRMVVLMPNALALRLAPEG
ncbi:MAG: MltA domain-containing protein [Rhodobacteraceae bacterium]|nr:MltA domain-containing protein [Paracoccaceae bacterium]